MDTPEWEKSSDRGALQERKQFMIARHISDILHTLYFSPVLYLDNWNLFFLVEDTSYNIPPDAIASDFGIELKLTHKFPDPIRKAQGKAIELDEITPNWLFWMRANHDSSDDKKAWRIVGFIIQHSSIALEKSNVFFDVSNGNILLQIMIQKFAKMKKISAKEADAFLFEVIREIRKGTISWLKSV